MTTPIWITSSNLGVYSETYSFNVNPLVVAWSGPGNTTVSQINGSLQDGLSWIVVGSNVQVIGESSLTVESTLREITWRLTAPNGSVADRTYQLRIDPVVNPPDWTGQPQFLGYAASAGTSTYTVTAHTDTGLPIVYAIAAFAPPTGITIESTTGVITYAAPTVAADQTTAFTVRATTGAVYSDFAVSIDLLTVPHAPAWVTDSGLIALVLENDFVEITLLAYDSSGAVINYAIVSSTPVCPFTLTPTGLLYGPTPTVYATTVYQFTVSATSTNGTTNQTMDIIASPVTIGALLYWTSPADLGAIEDGQYVTLDSSAVSSRGVINYSIVGGILPRGLILDRQSGFISGYMEYQTRDRSYLFDIQAADTIQTITRRCSITVLRSTQYQYMGITIPVEGSLKDLYYSYIGDTINSTWVPYSSTTPQSVLYKPFIQLINGLNYAINDPAAAIYFANLHLNTTELMIGATTNVNVSPTTTLFYSPILDSDAGAASQYLPADQSTAAVPSTVTVQMGSVTITVTPGDTTWLDTVVPGTQMRLQKTGTATVWLQGPVTQYNGSYSMTINVTNTSGSGTYAGWQLLLADTYPPSLVNIRNDLIAGLGWVTDGQGAGAQLLPLVDPTTTAVIGAEIVNTGTGYIYGPSLTVVGAGNGAILGANLSVISASIHNGGTGWQVGDTVQLDQPALSPAVVTVAAINSQGAITALTVTDGGEYASFPAGDQLLTNGVGAPAKVDFNLGIGNVWVAVGGSNYAVNTTTISTVGTELLPSWQTTWQPYLGMGTVFSQYGDNVVGNETTNVTSQIYYQRWPLQHAILELQGINWTGDTTFDDTSTAFDGGATFWAEWLEPRDTLFDQDLTLFNQANTSFDDDYSIWQDAAYYAWGSTLFDQEFTIFDLYSTIFDQGPTPTHSITLLRRLLRIIGQEISGHNPVS